MQINGLVLPPATNPLQTSPDKPQSRGPSARSEGSESPAAEGSESPATQGQEGEIAPSKPTTSRLDIYV